MSIWVKYRTFDPLLIIIMGRMIERSVLVIKKIIGARSGWMIQISDILQLHFESSRKATDVENRGIISHRLTPLKFRGGVSEMSE